MEWNGISLLIKSTYIYSYNTSRYIRYTSGIHVVAPCYITILRTHYAAVTWELSIIIIIITMPYSYIWNVPLHKPLITFTFTFTIHCGFTANSCFITDCIYHPQMGSSQSNAMQICNLHQCLGQVIMQPTEIHLPEVPNWEHPIGINIYKNFISRYIMRVTITIIDIIMISLDTTTATKIVKIRWSILLMCMFLSNKSYSNHSIYGNIVLIILWYWKFLIDIDYHDTLISW